MLRALLSLLLLGLAPAGAAMGSAIPWETSVARAKDRATKERRLIVVDFQAFWCGWCRVQEREIWSKPEIAELAKANVFLRLDVDDDDSQKLAEKLGVDGLPTVIVIDGKGNEVGRIQGYLPLRPFVHELSAMLRSGSRGTPAR